MSAFNTRIDNFLYDAWRVFAHKAGNEVFPVNNVVAMQLNFAYLLKKHIDFVLYDKKEKIDIELQHLQQVGKAYKTIDVLLRTANGKETLNIPLLLKCYRKPGATAPGDDAHGFFKKEVYEGLALLEQYAELSHFVQGYALLMTDDKSLMYTTDKASDKAEGFSLAQGHEITDGLRLKETIDGQAVDLTLKKSYSFEWHQHGNWWFALVQGI